MLDAGDDMQPIQLCSCCVVIVKRIVSSWGTLTNPSFFENVTDRQ